MDTLGSGLLVRSNVFHVSSEKKLPWNIIATDAYMSNITHIKSKSDITHINSKSNITHIKSKHIFPFLQMSSVQRVNSLWLNDNLINIGPGSGLLPVWHQTITWTNVDCFHTQTPANISGRETESKFRTFLSRKCLWKCHLQNVNHFVPASTC